MPATVKTALDTYASNKPGALSAYRAEALTTARFLVPEDGHARTFRVPTPTHVARFGIVPTIAPAAIASDVREAVAAFLSGVHRRFHGPLARRTPQIGREHLDDAPPFLPLADYYAGIHAALRLPLDTSHPDNAAVTFDRWDYEEAILTATFVELRDRDAHDAKRAASEAAKVAPRPSSAPTPSPALTAERRERYRATARAKRAAAVDAQREAVADALADLIEDGELVPGVPVTRAALADMVADTLAPVHREALAPRRLVALILAATTGLDVTETTLRVNGTRTRGFILSA